MKHLRRRTVLLVASVSSVALGTGVAFGAASDPDLSYDGDGIAKTNLTGNSVVNDVAIQTDGKVVAAGIGDTTGATPTAALTRYTTTGALDTASGFGAGTGVSTTTYGGDPTLVQAVAIRPTGAILTAGFTDEGSIDFGVVAQHLANGALDDGGDGPGGAGFGGGDGFIQGAYNVLADGSGHRFSDIAVVGSSFVAVGSMGIGGTSPSENAAFFGASEVILNISSNVGSTGEDRATSIALDPLSTDLIIAGLVDPTSSDGGANDDADLFVARLTSAGALDTASGFGGGDAIVTADIGDTNSASDVAVQPDGKIVVAGTRDPDGAGLDLGHFVMRFNANGTPDAGFGDGGGNFEQSIVTSDNFGDALVRLPDGRIVVGGNTFAGGTDWVVARYTAAGLPDTTWSGDGSRAYDFTPDSAGLNSLALQGDGKVIAGGEIADDFAVGRLEADPRPPVVNPPMLTPTPAPTPGAGPKKCRKGQKLRKGKCVKKKRKRKGK